jgi:hypothetical protein
MPNIPAYYDCFAGLLPCTATGIDNNEIVLRCNVTRGGYKRGEVFKGSKLHTFPREHFHRSRRGPFYFYTTPYFWPALLKGE